MKYIRIKNWKNHQHYTGRNPPWIKLHNSLFDDYEFCQLDNDSKLCLMLLWLLASRSTKFHVDGDPLLPDDEKYLSDKIGIGKKIPVENLKSLGFLIMYQDASSLQAKCASEAYKEETETEGETEGFSPSDMSTAWNERVDGSDLPRVIRLTTERRKKCLTRIKSLSLTPEKWNSALDGIYASDFLIGKNDRKWTASFDWLIKNDDNIVKVVEGGYR